MKFIIIFLLLAVATAKQLDNEEEKLDPNIDPIENQETPVEDKIHNKRTLLKARPVFRARHIGIRPLGFKYLLRYKPHRYNFVYRKPAVTFLKPVIHSSGWKPIIHKPVFKPVVKPITPVVHHPVVQTPTVVHHPVVQSPTLDKPIIVPTPQVPVAQPILPQQPTFIQYPTTVLKPLGSHPQNAFVPQLIPQGNPLLPIGSQGQVFPFINSNIHPFLRPLLTQFLLNLPAAPGNVPVLQHGNHFDGLLPLQPQPVLPHGNHLDVLQPAKPHLHLQPQPIIPHGHHLDVLQPTNPHLHLEPHHVVPHGHHLDVLQPAQPLLPLHPQPIVPHGHHFSVYQSVKPLLNFQPQQAKPHGDHLDILQPGLQGFLPHGHHINVQQPTVVQPEGVTHHGNHLDVVQPGFLQHGNHVDVLQAFKPLPNVHEGHLDIHGGFVQHKNHLDLIPYEEQNGHVHIENGEQVHTTQHVHPEEPNVVHSESHLHQDHNLVPHVHPVHPAPQLPLYLPHHPNYKPGISLQPLAPSSSSVQTEFSATFPKYPLLGH